MHDRDYGDENDYVGFPDEDEEEFLVDSEYFLWEEDDEEEFDEDLFEEEF